MSQEHFEEFWGAERLVEQWNDGPSEREQWAEDHGYWHGRCRIHGPFWTDGTGCERCQEE
jgi:hypothetical protein